MDKVDVCEQFGPLVRATAGKYRDVSFEDAVQTGWVALLEAYRLYQPNTGVPFAGYAAAKVRGDVRTEMRRWWTYWDRTVGSAGPSVALESNRPATDAWDVVADGVGQAFGASRDGLSAATEYSMVEWQCVIAGARLSPRERLAMTALMDGLSCSEVAERCGVSVETVKTWRKRALAKVRRALGVD